MNLALVLPLSAWLFLFVYVLRRGIDRGTSFLVASVVWGCSVTFLTELLSLFRSLNRPCLAAGWGLLAIVAALPPLFRTKPTITGPKPLPYSRTQKLMISAIGAVVLCTFVTAMLSFPYDCDDLAYHLGRIIHWIQQGAVVHFPTNILRQIEMNPWAEFATMHLMILSGGDLFVNLVQWFSFLGSIIGVTVLAGEYGAGTSGQLLAGMIAATIPAAILEANTAQNDIVVAFWLVSFILFGTKSARDSSKSWSLLMACSLGLALLTKGTAYIYALPFLLFFAGHDLKVSWRHTASKYLALAGIVLALNAGHLGRNLHLFHNPLHSDSGFSAFLANSHIDCKTVISNMTRNMALHMLTPSRRLNAPIFGAVQAVHSLIGMQLNDPTTTWPNEFFGGKLRLVPCQGTSGNPVHFCLFAIIIVIILFRYRRNVLLPYTLANFAGFLLFCTFLRWQPWHSRLHMPLFMNFSPVAAVVISTTKKTWIVKWTGMLLFVASFPWLFCNVKTPLISLRPIFDTYSESILTAPRLQSLTHQKSYHDLEQLALKIKNDEKIKCIGLDCGIEAPEFLFWELTRRDGLDGPMIEHIKVRNVSRSIDDPSFHPDIVVTMTNSGEVFTGTSDTFPLSKAPFD